MLPASSQNERQLARLSFYEETVVAVGGKHSVFLKYPAKSLAIETAVCFWLLDTTKDAGVHILLYGVAIRQLHAESSIIILENECMSPIAQA